MYVDGIMFVNDLFDLFVPDNKTEKIKKKKKSKLILFQSVYVNIHYLLNNILLDLLVVN